MGVEVQGLDQLDKKMKELFKNMEQLAKTITVGYQGPEAQQSVNPGDPSTVMVAAYNEFGTIKIPARSWMRSTVKENLQPLAKVIATTFSQVVLGNTQADSALGEVGGFLTEEMREKVHTARSWAVPNAPYTIKKKGAQYPPLQAGHDRLSTGLTWAIRSRGTIQKEGK